MNPELDLDDEMVLISQYYQPEIYSEFLPQQQVDAAASSAKPRRRRKKNKSADLSGEAAMMRKRKLSEEQVKMLEQSFGDEHKLESERKDRLAHELGLDPRQVAVWFQNRRARWKSKKLEEEYARLKSEHETTVVEKCRLESEILKLSEQLNDAEREIHRLSSDGFSSNSPCNSSLSNMEAMEQRFLGDFAMDGMFYNVQENNYYAHGMEWDNLYYL